MAVRSLTFVLFAGVALAQTQNPAVPPVQTPSSPGTAPAVAAGDIVLTIHGVCALPPNLLASKAGDCTVVVNRQQFDGMVKIVSPSGQMTPAAKQGLAKTYRDMLAFEAAAVKSGIDHSPQTLEALEWLRVRALGDLYRRGVEAGKASDEEIEEYYQQHLAQFEELKLSRMVAPKNNLAGGDQKEFQKKAQQLASEFRARAASGEDLDQLQKQLYAALGLSATPPATGIGNRRRAGFTPEVSGQVFSLRPGEVSAVLEEPYNFVIYKVETKRTLPEDRAKDEITREIAKQRREAALKAATSGVSADLNEKYFGVAKEPAAPPAN